MSAVYDTAWEGGVSSAYLVNCVYRYLCMVAYMSIEEDTAWEGGIFMKNDTAWEGGVCSTYLVNCVYRANVDIYVWLPIWALYMILPERVVSAALIWLTVCIGQM